MSNDNILYKVNLYVKCHLERLVFVTVHRKLHSSPLGGEYVMSSLWEVFGLIAAHGEQLVWWVSRSLQVKTK